MLNDTLSKVIKTLYENNTTNFTTKEAERLKADIIEYLSSRVAILGTEATRKYTDAFAVLLDIEREAAFARGYCAALDVFSNSTNK